MKKASELVASLRAEFDGCRMNDSRIGAHQKEWEHIDAIAEIAQKYLDGVEESIDLIDGEISDIHAASRDEFNRNWEGEK